MRLMRTGLMMTRTLLKAQLSWHMAQHFPVWSKCVIYLWKTFVWQDLQTSHDPIKPI